MKQTVGMRRSMAAVAVGAAGIMVPLIAPTAAQAAQNFTCKSKDVNTCVVTIPLTSNMNERVGSTMPDTHDWFMSEAGGNGTVTAPYTMSGPGSPDTKWDGVAGATQGHAWSALLTTGASEPAGGDAVVTFEHVTPISSTPKHYKSLKVSAPSTARRHKTITITAVVKPVPAAGHLQLQHKHGSGWKTDKTLTFQSSHHRWITHLTWTAPKHTTVTFRLLAKAAPALKATASKAFNIATHA